MAGRVGGGESYVPGSAIVLVPHDPAWASRFAREAELVSDALGELLLELHHIGSTAIRGIVAKPVIDMLAVVRDVRVFDAHSQAIEALGYEAMGEFGIAGRRYFRKNAPTGARTHQIHAFEQGSFDIARHLAFRDYLRADPESAAHYAALKEALAARCGADVGAYTTGKAEFIREIERRALNQRR